MNPIVLTCILTIALPDGGQICIKPTGEVEMPANMAVSEATKVFWTELAAKYPYICPLEKGETK